VVNADSEIADRIKVVLLRLQHLGRRGRDGRRQCLGADLAVGKEASSSSSVQLDIWHPARTLT